MIKITLPAKVHHTTWCNLSMHNIYTGKTRSELFIIGYTEKSLNIGANARRKAWKVVDIVDESLAEDKNRYDYVDEYLRIFQKDKQKICCKKNILASHIIIMKVNNFTGRHKSRRIDVQNSKDEKMEQLVRHQMSIIRLTRITL